MKKGVIFFMSLVVLLSSLSFISAIEITINPEFKSGETIQAKISGNFLNPLSKEDILFYRGHVKVPFDYDLAQIEEEYYISATQEKQPGNYSIEIKDAKFWRGSELVEEDIIIPFEIINQTAEFSIDKGYIVTNEDFYIQVQNLAEEKLTITSISNSQEKNISLKSGDIAKINFDKTDFMANRLDKLELSSTNLKYEIPIYIFLGESEETEKETGLKLVIDIDESTYLNISMPTNSTIKRIIYLYNSGNETMENITLSLSNSLKDFVKLSAYEIDELEANSSVKIEMQINSANENYSIQGQLKTKTSTDFYKYIPISIKFIKGYEPKAGEYGENITAPGKIIKPGDLTKNEETETGSTGKIIGWTILILVLIFLAWFFLKKYKGAKGPLTSFDRAIGR